MSERPEPARPPELAAIAGLGLLLLFFFLGLFVARGLRFPVGPDGPVYLWWTRLVGFEGLSAVERPGVPALVLVLAGSLHVPVAAAAAALQCSIGVAVGLAGAMLLRAGSREDRSTWLLGGALTGVFAVHLVSGYLANLALAATFLAGAVALSMASRRGAVAAVGLFAAGGFSHPQFFLVGLAILGLTAAFGLRDDARGWGSEPGRILAAMLGAGATVGAGMLALLAGPDPLHVDTSRDAFLRRVGMLETLKHLYRDRFVHRAARYVQWVSVPLAAVGLPRLRGFVFRFLAAWGVATLAGVAFGLVTALVPPDRFVTFGYVVPLLAAVGAMRLWRALHPRRAVATALVAGLVVLMALGTFFAWRREKPFLTEAQVAAVTTASRWIAATAPGTALFFVVETGDETITFFATQSANIIRAAVPPDRVRDVHVLVLPGHASQGSERAMLSRSTIEDYVAQLLAEGEHDAIAIEMRPFADPVYGRPSSVFPSAPVEVTPGLSLVLSSFRDPPDLPEPVGASGDPLDPSSPGQIVLATLAGLALLGAAGYGWARASGLDLAAAAALAPAFGLAALTLAAILLERAGVPLTGSIGPTVVSLAAGGGGYLVDRVLERRARGEAAA